MNFVDGSLELRQGLRRFILGWLRPRVLESEKARATLNKQLQDAWKPDVIDVYELIRDERDAAKEKTSTSEAVPEQKHFIVWIDPDLDIDWISNATMDSAAAKCVSFAEAVGARRCKHLPREQVLELKRLVGQAIVSAIQGEADQSSTLAKNAETFLKDRTIERSRTWTLTSAHLFIILFSLAILISYFSWLEASSRNGATSLLLMGVQGGVIGAYLSVIQKAGKGQWDAAAGRWIHHIEVFTQLLAGGVLGGLAFTLARSVHAPSSIKDIVPDGYSAIIFGVFAGMFERLIPKMISNYANV